MSGKTVEPQTRAEFERSEPCDRKHCNQRANPKLLVPVHIADVTQRWCPDCVEETAGIEYHGRWFPRTRMLITDRTVTAFVLGLSLALVVMSVLTV